MAFAVLCQQRGHIQWYKIETLIVACPSDHDFVHAIVTDNITMWLAAEELLMSDGATLLCIHQAYPTALVSLQLLQREN